MTRYAVTGIARGYDEPTHDPILARVIRGLGAVAEFTTGAAHGADTSAALWAIEFHPDALHRFALPAAPYNEAVIRRALPGTEFVAARRGRDDGESYMLRNDLLVAHADVLLAFPASAREPKNPRAGGGTWATVRRARKAGLEIRVYPLDGSDPWTEGGGET